MNADIDPGRNHARDQPSHHVIPRSKQRAASRAERQEGRVTGRQAGERVESVRLKDGTLCQIRPIGPDDPDVLNACFAGLSPASRRLRFFGAKQVLTAADLAYLTATDGRDHLAFAAIAQDPDGRDGTVLGAARCIRSAPGSEAAELAMAVVDQAQGRGVGTALLDRLTEAAQEQGIRRFHCEVLAENEGMRRLASRLGGQAIWLDDGAVEYNCALPEPASPAVVKPGVEPPGDRRAARHGSRASGDPDGVSSWERAFKAWIAVFETATLAWYECLSPISLERRAP